MMKKIFIICNSSIAISGEESENIRLVKVTDEDSNKIH